MATLNLNENQLCSMCNDLNRLLLKRVKSKIYDSNNFRSTAFDPHAKTITVADVHKFVFRGMFGPHLKPEERIVHPSGLNKSSEYVFTTVKRIHEIFGTSIIKSHKSKDLSLICPYHDMLYF